jgi:hypothetical protein
MVVEDKFAVQAVIAPLERDIQSIQNQENTAAVP